MLYVMDSKNSHRIYMQPVIDNPEDKPDHKHQKEPVNTPILQTVVIEDPKPQDLSQPTRPQLKKTLAPLLPKTIDPQPSRADPIQIQPEKAQGSRTINESPQKEDKDLDQSKSFHEQKPVHIEQIHSSKKSEQKAETPMKKITFIKKSTPEEKKASQINSKREKKSFKGAFFLFVIMPTVLVILFLGFVIYYFYPYFSSQGLIQIDTESNLNEIKSPLVE